MIQLSEVWYRTGGNTILSGIQLRVAPGEFVCVVGPSGAGKSTLLKMVHLEMRPTRGILEVANFRSDQIKQDEIPLLRRKVGMVFQDFKLLVDRDVYDNISFALWATGVPRRKIKKRVFQVLTEVGLSHKRYSMIQALSGGEQQRVAIARALANEPFVLLADEPTGNLDPEATDEIMKILERINRKGTAILMATHKEELVKRLRVRIVHIIEGKLNL